MIFWTALPVIALALVAVGVLGGAKSAHVSGSIPRIHGALVAVGVTAILLPFWRTQIAAVQWSDLGGSLELRAAMVVLIAVGLVAAYTIAGALIALGLARLLNRRGH